MTGETPVESTTTIKELFKEVGYFPDGTVWDDNKVSDYFKGDTFKDYSSHTMRMFYFERGAGASNLHMKFNLPVVPDGSIEVKNFLTQIKKSMRMFCLNLKYMHRKLKKMEHLRIAMRY